jgi:hypothetical protein
VEGAVEEKTGRRTKHIGVLSTEHLLIYLSTSARTERRDRKVRLSDHRDAPLVSTEGIIRGCRLTSGRL